MQGVSAPPAKGDQPKPGPKPWHDRLMAGMSKTRDALQSGITQLFSHKQQLDDQLLDDLHELLFRSDIGVRTVDKLIDHLSQSKQTQTSLTMDQALEALKQKTLSCLSVPQQQLTYPSNQPLVILIVGVNGVGKTTSIAKLTSYFQEQNKKVTIAAGDTFRAAAIDQLKVWGERLGVEVISHKAGGDPAAVCFDAVKAAKARASDVLLIDTAGRLQNKQNLMEELAKIKKVIGRDLPGAPHHIWLVIDATTGQNAFSQVATFKEVVDVTGLVVTKLDGTAKGGVMIGICDQFQIPIRFIGIGEKAEDLRPFIPKEFADSLFKASPTS